MVHAASSIQGIYAIDVHAHYGQYLNGAHERNAHFMSGDVEIVLHRARQANTRYTIVSPIAAMMPRGEGDPIAANEEAARLTDEHDGLLQWVVIDPRKPETLDQADRMLRRPKCVGIKIHPEEHLYPILEHGRAIFALAATHRTVVLSHSGEKNSLPADLLRFADDYPETRLLLAHLGCGWDDDLGHQVRAIQASRHGNVYVDTSSASSILPGLIEWAVKEVGAGRILYGTDTPLYFAPMQRARIDHANISDIQKRAILRDNAIKLFNLEETGHAN